MALQPTMADRGRDTARAGGVGAEGERDEPGRDGHRRARRRAARHERRGRTGCGACRRASGCPTRPVANWSRLVLPHDDRPARAAGSTTVPRSPSAVRARRAAGGGGAAGHVDVVLHRERHAPQRPRSRRDVARRRAQGVGGSTPIHTAGSSGRAMRASTSSTTATGSSAVPVRVGQPGAPSTRQRPPVRRRPVTRRARRAAPTMGDGTEHAALHRDHLERGLVVARRRWRRCSPRAAGTRSRGRWPRAWWCARTRRW